MTPTPDDGTLKESLIRLEAKIDVMLGRHEGKIDDLTRRQGETTSTLREHDARITANALTVAETRAQALGVQADVQGLQQEMSKRGNNNAAWVACGIAALAVVLSPILNALLHN